MAREGAPPVADYLRAPQPEEEEAAADGRLFVDAGRALMMWGWGALAAVLSAAGSTDTEGSPPDASTAVHALLALILWLLGVSLVALAPVARRFPRAARLGAAVADCLFPPDH